MTLTNTDNRKIILFLDYKPPSLNNSSFYLAQITANIKDSVPVIHIYPTLQGSWESG